MIEQPSRERLHGLADQHLTDARQAPSLADLLDQVDAGEISMDDVPLTDGEIIKVVGETFGMDRLATIARLRAIDFAALGEPA